jgi:hypothetical protein
MEKENKQLQRGTESIRLTDELYQRFLAEDQRAMTDGTWDYRDEKFALRGLKEAIEAVGDEGLSDEERAVKDRALWLWYLHAAQDAYFRHGEPDVAVGFIDKGLEHNRANNQVTPVLKLLFSGKIAEARIFAESLPDTKTEEDEVDRKVEVENMDKRTALNLVKRFEDGVAKRAD